MGLVQGLTEFLPVSSSGHLVLLQQLFGLSEPEIFFNICLHVGTLMAVVLYFRKDIFSLTSVVFRQGLGVVTGKTGIKAALEDPEMRQVLFIVIALFPTAVAGLLIEKISEILFTSVIITGVMLILTGLILWSTKRFSVKPPVDTGNTFRKALTIGLVQGFAVIPGISRSGSTIAAGLFLGLDKEAAARFSFLMSIPAIAGATVLSLKDVDRLSGISVQVTGAGMLIAAVSGYLALSFLVFIIKKGQLHSFAPYCWLAGATALVCGLVY